MKDALGYYEILQVSQYTDMEVIKRSYRDLAKAWHPDNNHDENATDIFQKLSIAYDVLGNPQNKLIYDILSLVYTKENYPKIDAMLPYTEDDNGVDVKVVNLKEVVSMFVKCKQGTRYKVTTYNGALKLNAKVALVNWLLGWWHPKGFLLNIKAIADNFNNSTSDEETLKIMLHNMIAYGNKSQNVLAAKCGIKARALLDDEGKKLVDEYVTNLNVRVSPPARWNVLGLKAVQFIMPVILILVLLKVLGFGDSIIWKIFGESKKINYYQTVNTGYGKSVDDVIVGKVISIPVDKSDEAQLYHLTKEAKVMYGPSEDFDMIKVLEKGATVRLTGFTPDKEWARIMIDNGDSGFINYKIIKQGKGNEIPYGSSIIE